MLLGYSQPTITCTLLIINCMNFLGLTISISHTHIVCNVHRFRRRQAWTKIIKTLCLPIFIVMFALMTNMLMLKNDQWPYLCLACEIKSCFMLFRFPKLFFVLAGTPTYAPYLEHVIKDHKLVFQTIFQISMGTCMCKIHRLCS